ncbi:biotin/lipoate A/B protein ligase family protein [soil metagenome]
MDDIVSDALGFIDLNLDTLAENLALDELLPALADEEDAGPTLRLWEWPEYAVVLGAGCRVEDDVDVDRCERDGIAIRRRSSGGGTVLLGPGCICSSLILPFVADPALRGVRSSYAWILQKVGAALKRLNPGIHLADVSDLAIGGRKFSGCSQQRKREHLLHHGSVLFNFDIARISRYLKLPPRRPEYRESRSHEQFLTNLGGSAEQIAGGLQAEWNATLAVLALPLERAVLLAREKYETKEWTYRR